MRIHEADGDAENAGIVCGCSPRPPALWRLGAFVFPNADMVWEMIGAAADRPRLRSARPDRKIDHPCAAKWDAALYK